MQPTLAWLGHQEMLIVFLIVLLLFGAKQLPKLAKGVGQSMGEFKKARQEFQDEMDTVAKEDVS